MITATNELEINRPAAEVFDFLADARYENEWNDVTRDVVKVTDGPISQGTRFTAMNKMMGPLTTSPRDAPTGRSVFGGSGSTTKILAEARGERGLVHRRLISHKGNI